MRGGGGGCLIARTRRIGPELTCPAAPAVPEAAIPPAAPAVRVLRLAGGGRGGGCLPRHSAPPRDWRS